MNTKNTVALPNDPHTLDITKWIAEQIPGGFFIYRADESQEILYTNEALIRIFGCATPEEFKELTGYTFRGMVHPDDYARVEASIQEQISDEDNDNIDAVEYRIIQKDGSIRWLDDYGHFTELPGFGKVYYVFVSDITGKKEIQRENQMAAQVIEGLSVEYTCIYLLDLNSGTMRTYHLKNKIFEQISNEIGMSERMTSDWHAVLTKYAFMYIVPDDQAMFLREIDDRRIRDRLAREDSYTVNYRCKTLEDAIVYVSMSVSRTRGDGQNERVVMGFRDVTASTLEVQRDLKERMETEMELEREKRANEIKSEFLFNVSHDIRTPMNAILGFASLARKHADRADRLDEYLGMVEDSGHQLLELINDLLDMSTLESGQLEFKTAPSDPAEQIAKVLELFEPDASKKNLRIVREIDLPYDELVLLDAQRFRRVIGNLVSNAVKFTPEGGHIKVSAHRMKHTESGYSRYQFAITDTGIGISDEYIKHIFNPFVREQSSTESGNTGTGLGLSIAKNLVDIMGGTLFVESKKGEGTTFTLELPLKHATDAKTESAPPAPAGDAAHTDGEYRILLVEDIELNRLLAETVLKESGFLVESVVDGCDAVDAVRDHPLWYYDLILMDIQMPVMNGYEATRAIRAVHRADIQSLPIVALSANAGEQDRQKSLDSGMNDHIAKPFNVTQLISTIRDHIESRATQVE